MSIDVGDVGVRSLKDILAFLDGEEVTLSAVKTEEEE
jgi:hypothetical protein